MKRILALFLVLIFSRCILFVEGDTENGAMPVFAQRMNKNSPIRFYNRLMEMQANRR